MEHSMKYRKGKYGTEAMRSTTKYNRGRKSTICTKERTQGITTMDDGTYLTIDGRQA